MHAHTVHCPDDSDIYAAVLIVRIIGLARPSVCLSFCPSVPYRLENEKALKTPNCSEPGP